MYTRTFSGSLKAAALASAAMLPVAGSAMAADFARVSTDLNVRAGPSPGFPVVTTVPDNSRVMVHGCVRGYEWCDISYQDFRGWVLADYLNYRFQGHYVPIVDYGDRIDLPVVGFSIGAYWDDYYRGRPWYRDRDRWVGIWRGNAHYDDYGRGREARRDRGDSYRYGDREHDRDMNPGNRGERYRDRSATSESGRLDTDRHRREANREEERGREHNAKADRQERNGQMHGQNREANKSGRIQGHQSKREIGRLENSSRSASGAGTNDRFRSRSSAVNRDQGGSSSGASSGESGAGAAQGSDKPMRGGGDRAGSRSHTQ